MGNKTTKQQKFLQTTLKIFFLILLLSFSEFSFASSLEITLPKGKKMSFQQICVGAGGELFASRKFNLGDPNGGYKESPTGITLGGAFPDNNTNRQDWCYYLGTTEVTVEQYFAIMEEGKEELPTKLQGKEKLPIVNVSWFEAQQFIDKLNQWVQKNDLATLPRYGENGYGYFRLPTEEEWEFAAKGGGKVTPEEFDKSTPYNPNKIASYEWFSGPKSSHNKLKKAGILSSNPLGLHDMLGNVAEMTINLYRVEYYQGRSGGFVARGGHYLTKKQYLRSSVRSEQSFYRWNSQKKKMEPNVQSTLGFRLALSTILYPERAVAEKMKTSWDDYRKTRGAKLPAAISIAPTNQQINVQTGEAAEHLLRLKKQIQKIGSKGEPMLREIGFIESSFSKTKIIQEEAAKESSFAWILIAGERALNVHRQQQRNMAALTTLLQMAEKNNNLQKIDQYKKRIKEVEESIENSLQGYSTAIRQMGKIEKTAIDYSLEKYNKYLLNRNASDQIQILPTIIQHIEEYQKTQRSNLEKWRKDLLTQ